MADTTTGLPVQTLSGQFVSTKIVDSGGANVAAVDASGRVSTNIGAIGGVAPSATAPLFVELSTGAAAYTLFGQAIGSAPWTRITDGTTTAGVIAGTTALKTDLSSIGGTAPGATAFVPSRLTDGSAYYTRTGQAVGTAEFASITDGTLTATVRDTGTNDSLNVSIVDASGNQIVSFGGGTQYVGDAAATATPTGTMAMGLANAAAPAGVSADNDAVAQWFLRNGSAVMNLASGGTLVTIGQKTAANGLPVTLASDQATATAPLHVVLGTGAADYTLFGQAVGSAPFTRVTDGTNTAAVIVTINSLKTDLSSIAGVVPGATAFVPARLTDGTAYYTRTGQTAGTGVFSTINDGTTTAGVIAGTTALKTDISSVAGTATVTGGINGLQAVAGGVAADAAVGTQNPLYVGAKGSTAIPTAMTTDGDLTALWASLNGALNVITRDASGNYVSGGGTEYVGDAAATATPTGRMNMALANAAAPSDVSANADAVAFWALRNGSLVVNVAAGGTLWTNMGQAAASGQFVRVTDGTNTAGVIAGTTALKTDLSSIAGTAPGATSYVPSRLTDGSAYYTNTGQTAGTSVFSRINDGTTTAGVIAGTTALKVDLASIIGSVPGATNPIPVRITDGSAFYSAASAAPVDPKYGTATSAALGAGSNVRLNHYVTSGKTGQLIGIDCGSTVPCKVEIQTIVSGTPTTRVVLFTKSFEVYQWRAPYKTFITRASADATSGFSVTVTNKDAAVAADVYSTGYWDEV